MKRGVFLLVIIISLLFNSANAATMTAAKTILELPFTKNDQVSALLLTPVSVILIGTTESNNSSWLNGNLSGSSDAYAVSYSSTGSPLWNVRMPGTGNEIATSAAVDVDGSIWVVGAGSAAVTAVSPTSPAKVLNPDNVQIEPMAGVSAPLNRIKLWQLSPTGNLQNSFEFISENIISPKKILVSASNLVIVGNTFNKSIVTSFYLSVSKTGIFSPMLKYGLKNTSINSAFLNPDFSVTAVGSSAEILLQKKPMSKLDAITMKLSSTGTLEVVARATLKNTIRTWTTIDSGLLQGGAVTYTNKTEAAVTKYSALNKPVWNTRYPSKGAALVASGKNSWATFVSNGLIKGVNTWKPKTPTGVLLEFGKKGEVTSAYSLASFPVAIATNNEIGTVVVTDSGVSFGLVVIKQ